MTVLVTLVYLPTFSGEFILDDRPLIQKNPYVKNLHSPISYFAQEDGVTDECIGGSYHTAYYRPIINVTYSIDYALWGLSASGFRTTNLFLHLFCCFVFFNFIQYLVIDRSAAFWATLIFALHPVNTESVSWIGSRDNILVALFSISSLFLYIKSWEDGSRLKRISSVSAFVLAVLSKEMGLMVLPLFFLYQRLLSPTRRRLREELLSYLPFIIVAIGYFFLRKAVTSSFSSPLQMGDLWQSVCFAPYVMLWNLKLIFLPYGLHSFVVGYPSTYLNWQALAGFCYSAFLVLLIWRMRKNRLMIFSVLSFHVLIFPTLNIVPTSAISLVSMRWLYLPMAFLTIVFALIIKGFLGTSRFVARSVICAVLVYLSVYSYVLNTSLWNNESNFFRQEVLNFGNYYYAGGLAEDFFEKNEHQNAEKFYQIGITHYPLQAMNYLNYAALLIDAGRPDVALVYLKKAKALSLTPDETGQWFNNMGAAYFRLGKYDESIKYFLKAVNQCPRKIQYHINLGGAYAVKGDYTKASFMLENSMTFSHNSIPLRKNLSKIYIQMKRYRDAVSVLRGIPKDEWHNYGVQEMLENARMGLRQSDAKEGEK